MNNLEFQEYSQHRPRSVNGDRLETGNLPVPFVKQKVFISSLSSNIYCSA